MALPKCPACKRQLREVDVFEKTPQSTQVGCTTAGG